MHKLYELKDKLIKELEDYSENGKFSEKDVEAIKYITSSIDHICNIVERSDDEYSMAMDGRPYDSGMRGGYSRNSYARGRGRGARRDSMGRYSSEGYSMNDGTVEDLREIMMSTDNEQVKRELREVIRKVESMM